MADRLVGDVIDDVLMPEAELVGGFTARRKGGRVTIDDPSPSTESPDTDRPDFGKRFGRRVEKAVRQRTRPLGLSRTSKRRY